MEDTEKRTREILGGVLSGDPHRVWSSSCAIMKMSQDEEYMNEFVPYLDEIRAKTANLQMGGLLVSNDKFVNKMIRILEHYKVQKECSCCLFGEDDNPSNYKTIEIIEVVYIRDSNYVDYYVVECKKCNQKYRVYEREYHFLWWDWKRI